jgi:hypothetical protein
MIRGSSPGGAGNFSLHHCIQSGSRAHSGSYPMGTRGSPWGQSGWVENLTTLLHLVLRSKNAPSWHGAHLKHRDNFTTLLLPFVSQVWILTLKLCFLIEVFH